MVKKLFVLFVIATVFYLIMFWLFRDAEITEYDYSGCGDDTPTISTGISENCAGIPVKTEWTGYLPKIGFLLSTVSGATFVTAAVVNALKKFRTKQKKR